MIITIKCYFFLSNKNHLLPLTLTLTLTLTLSLCHHDGALSGTSSWRGNMPIEDLDAPFDIVRYEGKLYSLRNRRTPAFSMVNGARHPPG